MHFLAVLKRPLLPEKIDEVKTMALWRKTSEDKYDDSNKKELQRNEMASKQELKQCIVQYMKCISELLADENDDKIRSIINDQDANGNTPLYYSAKYWPQSVTRDLLKAGADLSIKNKEGKTPLRKISKATLLDLFDNYCMKSDGLCALDEDTFDFSLKKSIDINDEGNLDEHVFQKLLDDYEPRFMTNIQQSPITFDYEILAPNNSSTFNHPSKKKKLSTAGPEMSVLSDIGESKPHRDLVMHPVVKSFIWMKWNRVRRYYHRQLRIDILLMSVLTWYIFAHFGGLEWNNNCLHASKSIDTNCIDTNGSDCFCHSHKSRSDKIHELTSYGENKFLSFTDRMTKILSGTLHASEPIAKEFECLFTNPPYICFLLLSMILFYWMILDAKSLFERTNTKTHSRSSNKFLSTILPLGTDLLLFVLMIAILKENDAMIFIAISIFSFLMFIKELVQFIVSPFTYFKNWTNWSDMIYLFLIVLVVYFPTGLLQDTLKYSLSLTAKKVCDKKPEFHPIMEDPNDVSVKRGLAGFLIVLSWTRIIFLIATHPGKMTEAFNKYTLMYRKVARSFLRLLLVYGLFIVAFSIGFYVMFHDDVGSAKLDAPTISSYVFFNSPYEALVKTFAMLVGEVDFNNIPIGISYSRRDGNISSSLGYLFFLLFIFMVVMVLMNLLNGLAVTDIAAIIRKSEILHQVSMIEILAEFEEKAMKNRKILKTISRCCPCLKRVIFKLFDISEELLLYPSTLRPITQDSSYQRSTHINKQASLPYPISGNDLTKPKGITNGLMNRLFGNQKKIGYESIVSEARKILLKANKSKFQLAMKEDSEKGESIRFL